jgi:hypothetical protein
MALFSLSKSFFTYQLVQNEFNIIVYCLTRKMAHYSLHSSKIYIKKAVFVKMVVKILKPILTRNKQFCALKLNLQANFLKMKTILQKLITHSIVFYFQKQQSLRKELL